MGILNFLRKKKSGKDSENNGRTLAPTYTDIHLLGHVVYIGDIAANYYEGKNPDGEIEYFIMDREVCWNTMCHICNNYLTFNPDPDDFVLENACSYVDYSLIGPSVDDIDKIWVFATLLEDKVIRLLSEIIGTTQKPAKVKCKELSDGSKYTGEAILCTDGFYLPYGYGNKIVSEELEIYGHWVDGYADGVCSLNMHHSMLTGHFSDNRPNGWCLSIFPNGRRKGFVFGVFKGDDCELSLGDCVMWMMRGSDIGLTTNYKLGFILAGKVSDNIATGFHFMNNGDVYVGKDGAKRNKTGYFFKFTKDGYIQIGRFESGFLVEVLSPQEVVMANGMDVSLLPFKIDTKRKYF